ncbi:MAG: TetR family transcriptional regulator [Paracoccaceae bacterium]
MNDTPAQGLRARHRADRTRRILDAAAELFRKAGYESVTLEEIAVSGDVSVGTLYNYFATKGDLLMAIVTLEVEEVLALGARLLASPGGAFGPALDALVGGYFDHTLTYLSKDMWRRAIALSIEAPGTPFSLRYSELDGRLSDQVGGLVAAFQAKGKVRPEVDARVAGEVIFNNLNNAFIEFVRSEAMPMAALKARVAAQNAMLAAALGAG